MLCEAFVATRARSLGRSRRTAEEVSDRLEPERDADEPTFGLLLPGGRGLPAGRRPSEAGGAHAARAGEHRGRAPGPGILHAALLNDRLGIDAEAVAVGDRLAYTRDEADARRAVDAGEAQAAILVRPTRLEQLAAVAMAGDVMPQKSTYFYPKLLTGMVFNPLED